MANTIKGITIKLGADASELTTALRNANNSLKSTQSNLREVNNALKFNPNNVTLLKQKQTELTNAIEATKTKLENFKSALKQMDDSGVEKTDATYMALERDIIKAENQLESFNNELKQVNAQVSPLGQVGLKFQEIGSKCTELGNKLRGVSTAAAGVVASVGAVTYSTARWADDLNTLSKVTGIATDQLQIYSAAADLVDVDVSTIAKSVARMKKNMLSASEGTGTAAEAFTALGVSVTDANGNLRDQDDVFQELLSALGQMENETERDAYAMAIFGKSATELNPLIEDCGQTYEQVAQLFAENGLDVIDQETLDKANEFNDSIDTMKLLLEQAKQTLGAKLGDVFGEDIKQLSEWIGDLSEKIANINPNVLKVITIIAGIVAALSPVLIVIGAVASGVGTIRTVVSAVIPIITSVGGVIGTVFTTLAANPIGLIIVAIMAAILVVKKLYDNCEDFRKICDKLMNTIKNLGSKIKDFISGAATKLKNIFNSLKDTVGKLGSKIKDFASNVVTKLKNAFNTVKDIGKNIVTGLWNGITNKFQWLVGKIKEFASNVKSKLKSFFGIKSPSKWAKNEVGKMIVAGMGEGIADNAKMLNTAMESLIPSTTPTLNAVSNEMINAVGTGMALANSGGSSQSATIVVNLGGVKVAEQIYKLNKQGQMALQG